MNKCENCENEHDGEYGSGRFCSTKCARGYSTKNKRAKINKKVSKTNKLVACKVSFCNSCDLVIKNKWNKCCTKCYRYIQNIKLFKKLNVYEKNLLISNKKALELLYNDYFVKKLSKPIIMKKYNIMSNTIYDFFRKNGIELRNLSDAVSLSYETGRNTPNYNPYSVYNNGWHTTWNNKQVYYRSSYELEYAQNLDSKEIDYDMESLRIKYFDTTKNKNRIAIPDFYLKEKI